MWGPEVAMAVADARLAIAVADARLAIALEAVYGSNNCQYDVETLEAIKRAEKNLFQFFIL